MKTLDSKKKIIQYINRLDKVFEKSLSFTGKYVRPVTALGDDETEFDKHKVRTHLSEHNIIVTAYFSYVHKWFPANPHKKNIIERGNELYIDKITSRKKFTSFPDPIIINKVSENNLNPALRVYNVEKVIKYHKYIVVQGNKGVGKTTFFNYWLNNRTSYLENQEKKIWFRVDASKLYGIWLNFSSKPDYSAIDLETYHKVHTVYVAAKYGHHNGNSIALRQGWDCIQDKATEDDDLFFLVDEIEKAVAKSNNAPDNKDTERFFDWIITNNLTKEISRIYDYCYKLWISLGYRIIFIVDGIDNISWTRESIDHYYHLCNEVGRLFISDYRKEYCDDFANIIIVVRPETFKDIESRSLSDHMNTDRVEHYFKCLIVPTCTYNILTHKAKVTICPISEDITEFKNKSFKALNSLDERKKHASSNLSLDKEIEDFNIYSKEYIEGLINAIQSRYKQLDKFYLDKSYSTSYQVDSFDDISQIIEILFNDNIRACVDNFIENYSTIKLAKEKKIPGATSTERYPEYLLLNGRLFLDSPEIKTRVRGESYPNLFWWDESWVRENQTKWYGMVTLRILQLLNESDTRLSVTKTLLESIFNYPDTLIRKQIDRLIKYGLIKYSHKEIYEGDYLVQITKKGKFILEFTFMYSAWLYFCALDTPLDNTVCRKQDSRFIKIHRDLNYDFITRFNVAYITTVITFCRHLWTQQQIDEKLISNKWEIFKNGLHKDGVFNTMEHAINIFSFPQHFSFFVKEDIKALFIGLLNNDPNEANTLINDLIGLYKNELSI